jgi:hypothetical protein
MKLRMWPVVFFGIVLVIALGVIGASPGAHAQGVTPGATTDERINRMVDDVKSVIGDAERRRSPDQQTISELKRIVQRYDWPWRVKLLQEEFRDGDMTRNPPWTVASGNFFVDAQLGMRSQEAVHRAAAPQPAAQPQPQGGFGGRVLGTVLDEMTRGQTPQGQAQPAAPSGRAETFVSQSISNAFAVTLAFNSRSRDGGRIEFALFEGADRRAGYRLAYNPGASPRLELIRATATGSGVVESTNAPLAWDDGANHRIQWTRTGDGAMQIQADGSTVMETSDRGITGAFDGFAVVNLGGDYGLRSVTIDGTEKR